MKRSGQVGLVAMGAVTFVATFAAGNAFMSWQRPSAQAAQTCTARPDGTQNCEPARRGFAYYLLPHYFHGGSSASASASTTREAALTGNSRATTTVSSTGAVRGGFGATSGSAPMRVSAGG